VNILLDNSGGTLDAFLEWFSQIQPWIIDAIKIIIVIIVAIIVDRIILRKVTHLAIEHGFPKQTIKGIMFFVRFAILAGVFIALATVTFIPSEYFAGVGALIGTAIGFASAKAVSDFLSGAYALLSGVVKIGDYIRVDSQEGIVTDMSVSYTKIMKDDGSVYIISNKKLLEKALINFRIEKDERIYYIYPLRIKLSAANYDEIQKVILEKAKELEKEDIKITHYVGQISKSDIEVVILIETEKSENIPKAKFDLLSAITERISK